MDLSSNRLKTILINYVAALSLLLPVYFFYLYLPHYQVFFSGSHDLIYFTVTTKEVFNFYLIVNIIALPLFYYSLPQNHQTKSFLFWRASFNIFRRKFKPEEKIALLGTLVKIFFIPLVLLWFFHHITEVIRNILDFIEMGDFFPKGYWLLFHIILLVDVAFFLIGYTIEHPKLNNDIRSVEPTLLGWLVALACYPPFNGAVESMLGWYSSDYPRFDDPLTQTIFGILILLLMAIYSWASVALNLKASNLTNRGIVSKGPYAYVRHPAYAAKNLAWWIGSIPVLYVVWLNESFTNFLFGVFSVLCWSAIYYARAITEENHLTADPDYQNYCQQVKYKFIPKIW